MLEKLKKIYQKSTLASKIRISYLIVVIPMLVLLIVCVYNLWSSNRKYENMLNSAVTASDFSLDFKKDFDYETYLLIVGNKTIEESGLNNLLTDANQIVGKLEKLTDSRENNDRLASARKYLANLEIYKGRIEENIIEGNNYEKNLEIWENDVQIVTSLLRETVIQYIYYEIRDIQQTRDEYQQFDMILIRSLIVAAIFITLVVLLLSYFIPQSITRPIRQLSEATDQVAKGDLSVRTTVNAGSDVMLLSESLNTMIDKINQLLEQVKQEQIHLRDAELELLQAQINPHFLYNTLDTIVWLAEAGDQKKVVSMVGSLSKFFRTSLNQGKDIISIEEELQHVRSYLEIQQIRYQDILEYEIDVPQELGMYRIPKITIQPLVENALYHGIKNKRGLGTISITGEKAKDCFYLYVTDNGIGMGEKRLQQIKDRIGQNAPDENEIYGLYNVNERIRLKFGQEYGISIKSVHMEGTQVCIRLPYVIEENTI